MAFFIHKCNDVLSQFPEPNQESISDFEKVLVAAKTPSSIIGSHGLPYYIKVDVEHYDNNVLMELFQASIFPPFISSEAHDVTVFATLLSMGGYEFFKLLDGLSLSKKYRHARIRQKNGTSIKYSFPSNSAGPFGDDIDGDWFAANNFFKHSHSTG